MPPDIAIDNASTPWHARNQPADPTEPFFESQLGYRM